MWMVEGFPRPGALVEGMRVLDALSVPLLRGSLGVVFVWFGALKVSGATPVADLVASTVPWLASGFLVAGLGVLEVLLGLALVAGRFLRVAAVLVMAHLGGTFLTLVVQPAVAFRAGNPLLLTLTGEFVVKNLVLFTAALVVLCAELRRGGVR
ncbi:hypothetical protein GCM10010492_58900 [Saccharothrix mutabilis subsp. mutabilis]|uniref:Uncharacterized protein n=2 Tax=Saccharothrix mutabilis TaxID=33921 RepID=A0ABP3E6E7_9PSEU